MPIQNTDDGGVSFGPMSTAIGSWGAIIGVSSVRLIRNRTPNMPIIPVRCRVIVRMKIW